ncbi:MAG: hypothetical protein IJ164_00195 [Duodenibacillus sp.]|nr:hypothetical protein [Duodenibacillus sp.]
MSDRIEIWLNTAAEDGIVGWGILLRWSTFSKAVTGGEAGAQVEQMALTAARRALETLKRDLPVVLHIGTKSENPEQFLRSVRQAVATARHGSAVTCVYEPYATSPDMARALELARQGVRDVKFAQTRATPPTEEETA